MSWALEFHPEAEAELACVTGDFDAKRAGLGIRFSAAFERLCELILEDPLRWRELEWGTRRATLPGFPYVVVYLVIERRVVVLAVAHESRDTGYWAERFP